jgi:hypothetical protein
MVVIGVIKRDYNILFLMCLCLMTTFHMHPEHTPTIAGVSGAGSGCGLAPRTRPGYFFYVIQGLRGPEAPHTPATCPARTMTAQAGWQMWRVCRGCPCVCMLTLGLCCRLPYNPSEPPWGAGMLRPRGIARCTRPYQSRVLCSVPFPSHLPPPHNAFYHGTACPSDASLGAGLPALPRRCT